MKTTKILASAFILFALNVNTMLADTSIQLINSIENNNAYALKENGRNQYSRFLLDNYVPHFASIKSKQVTFNKSMQNGRNVAAIDIITITKLEEKTPFFAKAGRNKLTDNILISMQ